MFSSLVQGQNAVLKGSFYPVKKDISWVNELFSFNKDDFHLTIRHCQGLTIGKGKYKIIGDTLLLDFKDYPVKNSWNLIKSKQEKSDSITFSVTVYDEQDGSVLPGVNLIVKDKNLDTESDSIQVNGFTSDINGNVSLSIQNDAKERIIFILSIGYMPVEIPVDKNVGNYQEYKIHLGFNSYFQKGDNKKYRIEKSNANNFTILHRNDYKVKLARISKRKYEKLKTRNY